ncbi:MAG: PSD1 and planctomycete cytochrome C domain-containing protein [Gemmataceae bacterium]|nr:PSD1 and planctomycete cytochrome C domain-containing protein [Gemmataceae bacterium]
MNLAVLSPLLAGLLVAQPAPRQPAPQKVEFNRDIRPILSDNCFTCHGPAKSTRKADLRFDIEESAKEDRGGYHAIVPGKPGDSELIKRVATTEKSKLMPPPSSNKKLTPRQINLLRQWIAEGAQWQQHWAFITPRRPPLPPLAKGGIEGGWPTNPIDRFILARLEKEGLAPMPQASPETLIRRVTLDLTGLPPTIAEIDEFLKDCANAKPQAADTAYRKLVERLLASPRYGERMVLDWLDAARYSDTNGYQTDGTRAMWPWRDWVIEAFNKNMPFDQFTIEQIAGDLLPPPSPPSQGGDELVIRRKVATGFHRNHMLNGEGGRIAEESRVDYVVDRVDTTGTVWLGLTVGCARCHEHKYDPLSQKEYYQLYAFYNNIAESGGVDRRSGTAAPVLELPTPEQRQRIDEQGKKVADLERRFKELNERLQARQTSWENEVLRDNQLPAAIRQSLLVAAPKRSKEQKELISNHYFKSVPERQKLQTELDQARKKLTGIQNSVLITMIMEDRKEPRESFVLKRGVYNQYGEKVHAKVPDALHALPKGAPNNRLGLAKWLVSKDNPLTARVTVNRLWQMLFGTGLVKTTEDFGIQGEPPSHPELLDWLAVEFMQPSPGMSAAIPGGQPASWDIKHILRLIVTSATYRQQSRINPAALEKDPDNRLLAHFPRLRLPSFFLRDQALAVSGLLVDKIGGPPVRPYQPPGLWEDFSFNQIRYTQDKGDALYRRSLYTFWRRSIGPPNMFDTPARQVCTVRQSRTNTPLHALTLMNDTIYVEAARKLAERMMKEGGTTPAQRLAYAFRLATARPPSAAEQRVLVAGFERALGQYRGDKEAANKLLSVGESPRDERLDAVELAAYAALANMIMSLDEVVTRE